MPKYYKKKYYRGGRDKYSVEQSAGVATLGTDGNGGVVVCAPTDVQGMRKVKHLTVSMASEYGGTTAGSNLFWALVYVPQGTGVGAINTTGTGSMYEPNQFVMGCGVFDFDGGPQRIHCPISRNLNSGDQIALVLKGASSLSYKYVVRYAITLQ